MTFADMTPGQLVLFVVVVGGALVWSVWMWRGPR